MPVVATFMGLVIKKYYQQAEHNPPHVHVEYAGNGCAVSLESGLLVDGSLPLRQQRLVKRWVLEHRLELIEMWETQVFHKIQE